MPRNIPIGLLQRIQSGATTLTELFEVQPRYGNPIYLTKYVCPIEYEGNGYLSKPGVALQRLATSADLAPDNSEIIASFLPGVVEEGDMYGRRFDGGRYKRTIVDSLRLDLGGYVFQTGTVGNVVVIDGIFRAELRSLSQALQGVIGKTLSATCRHKRVGDSNCRFNLDTVQLGTNIPFKLSNTIVNVGNQLMVQAAGMDIYPNDWFTDGVFTVTSGKNTGFSIDVLSHTTSDGFGTFVLQEPAGFDFAVGDTFSVTAGCNRKTTIIIEDELWHCRNKFRNDAMPLGNMVNFGGEPYCIGPNKQSEYQGNP
jgi:uncharacterized phage protein (TIGR02218 family)